MKPILRFLLPTLAVGLVGTPLAAQTVVRQAPHAQSGAPIRGSIHESRPIPPRTDYGSPNPVSRQGILPAYVHPPSFYGPPVAGYGVYPNVRYFRRHGHVYAYDYTTNETYLVQW